MKYSETGALPNPLTPENKYRWSLWRVWDEAKPLVCWVLLNPSTADAKEDDPTIRKVVGFSNHWGFGAAVIVNLYAWRSTNPKVLSKLGNEAVGTENDWHIQAAVLDSSLCVAGWGTYGTPARIKQVRALLPKKTYALKLNADASPQHPLYLSYETPLVELP